MAGSGFHSSKSLNCFSPKNFLNSFIVHTPHWRACMMPMISITLRTPGVPRARYAPAGLSVASSKIVAISSSANLPSGPRCSLANINEGAREKEEDIPGESPLAGIGIDSGEGLTEGCAELFYSELIEGLAAERFVEYFLGPFFVSRGKCRMPLNSMSGCSKPR